MRSMDLGNINIMNTLVKQRSTLKRKVCLILTKKIVMVPQCGVCTWERVPEGGLVRLCDTFEGFPNPSTPPNLDGSETPQ